MKEVLGSRGVKVFKNTCSEGKGPKGTNGNREKEKGAPRAKGNRDRYIPGV